jgi:ABC-type multidrug transport system permease subunit
MENNIAEIQQPSNGPTINILSVAKAQKGLLIIVLINFISVIFIRHWAASLLVSMGAMYFTYKLLVALNAKNKIVWLIGMIVPLLSLILLLILNSRATKAIQAAGFKVGILGADTKQLNAQTTNT